jgi:predicted transcriptional regulator
MTPLLYAPSPRRVAAPTLLQAAFLVLADGGPETTLRRRLYALVQSHPGLHQRELARQLGVRASHAEYHLHQLARVGLIVAKPFGGRIRYFVAVADLADVPMGAVGTADEALLAILRQSRPLQIAALLLEENPRVLGDLARRLGVAPGTITYHIDKMEQAGILRRHAEGAVRKVSLTDRDGLVRILLNHPPPSDLIAGFEDVWDELGF